MRPNRVLKRSDSKQHVKNTKAKLKIFEKKVSSLKKCCCVCEEPFDDHNKALLDTWMIKAEADQAFLFCPKCFVNLPKEISAEVIDS